MGDFWVFLFGASAGFTGGFVLSGIMKSGKDEDVIAPFILTNYELRLQLKEAQEKIADQAATIELLSKKES